MIRADLHSHTLASHGLDPAQAMLEAGRAKGLHFMGISEHSILPPGFSCALYTGDLAKTLPALLGELKAIKNTPKETRLLIGLELDWTPANRIWMERLVASFPFDHVLGSLHYLDGKSVGNPASWPVSLPLERRFERFASYYYEMASMCASGLINIAAHPDFIKLRVWEDFQAWLATAEAKKAIGAALAAMARHGVAMELNSAGLRQPFREFYPGSEIMKLARESGVDIAFGSDAHASADVAADLEAARKYALAHGFTHQLIFMGRKAQRLPLT